MAVYVISDLHLSKSVPGKSMEAFGQNWQDYQERLEKAWMRLVGPGDTVIIPGDLSWALNLDEALEDFRFLDRLPGRKLIGKGNHDFFWTSLTKMNRFFSENGLESLQILYNGAKAFEEEGFIACGTRGWFSEGVRHTAVNTGADDEKIFRRELIRLRMSLDEARRLQDGTGFPIYAFLHFPPVFRDMTQPEVLTLLEEYGVKRCYYGHMHGVYDVPLHTRSGNLDLFFVAADYLGFIPYPVSCPEQGKKLENPDMEPERSG